MGLGLIFVLIWGVVRGWGWCEFWWLVWDYWILFENGLILFGVLWFLGGILGWFDGIGGFLGSWKLLEIKDFSKVCRSDFRMIFGYFGWDFWVIEGSGREVEIWVGRLSGTHSPSGSLGRFSGNVKYPRGYKGFWKLHIIQKCKIFFDQKVACLGIKTVLLMSGRTYILRRLYVLIRISSFCLISNKFKNKLVIHILSTKLSTLHQTFPQK